MDEEEKDTKGEKEQEDPCEGCDKKGDEDACSTCDACK